MERFDLSWERREGWEPAAWQTLIQLFYGIIWSQNYSKIVGFRRTHSFLGCHLIWRWSLLIKLQICSTIKKGIWSLCLLQLSLLWPLETLPLSCTWCLCHACGVTPVVLPVPTLVLRPALQTGTWLCHHDCSSVFAWVPIPGFCRANGWAAQALSQCPASSVMAHIPVHTSAFIDVCAAKNNC